jgi:hypothetical protein
MALVRTNITIPDETLALVDAVAGPRGRSAYIADVVARQVRRDNARMVFEKYAGFLKDSDTWGRTPEETVRLLRELRDDSERDRKVWGPYEEDLRALSPGHDDADRSRDGASRGRRTRARAVQRAE